MTHEGRVPTENPIDVLTSNKDSPLMPRGTPLEVGPRS